MKPAKRMFVPSRIEVDLVKKANLRRTKDALTWPELMKIMFESYIHKGLEAFQWTKNM